MGLPMSTKIDEVFRRNVRRLRPSMLPNDFMGN